MTDKQKYYLEKIENQFPNRKKLNQGEMLQCINKSRATFLRLLHTNDLHLVPKFEKIEHKRKGTQYNTYTFDVFDVAEFLAS